MNLSAEERATLRRLVDERRRELAESEAERAGHDMSGRCKGCGCEYDVRTDGCAQCWDRHRNRSGRRKVFTHNRNGYLNGCRCDVCRVDYNARSREYYQRSLAERRETA